MVDQLKNKEEQITNLTWIMWASILLAILITAKTTVTSIYHYVDWGGAIISAVIYFFIAFSIGQHSKWNEDIIWLLFLLPLFALIYISHFVNVYLYLLTLFTLLIGYFAGYGYTKITASQNDEGGI